MWTLYWRLVGARIRAQMQYKVSFLLDLVGYVLKTVLDFAVIAILFSRFPSIGGWNIAEVALLYGLTTVPFSLNEMISRGFDSPFELMMQRGTFDSVLTRPLGSFFQVLTSEFQLRRLGRTAQGTVVLLYAFSQLSIAWTPADVVLVLLTLASGTLIFMALYVIGAAICFWTIKTPEIINALTFGGTQLTSYPLSIYHRVIRTIFLFIIPVAFVNYPTALILLNRADPLGLPRGVAWAAPLVAGVFFTIALGIWRIGVSKYTSAG